MKKILKKDKKGLSEVISTLLILILTVAVLAGLWLFVQNFVLDKLGTAKKCSGIAGKIEFGQETCYVYKDIPIIQKELRISLNHADLKMDGVLISVTSMAGESKSFKITVDGQSSDANVKEFGGSYGSLLPFPEENSGKIYIFNLDSFGEPKTIEMVPIIEKEYCASVDLWNDIPVCSS